MLKAWREFRWYALSIPIAALVYALAGIWVPLIRPGIGGVGALSASQPQQRPIVIKVVENMPTSVKLSPDALAVKPGESFEVNVWLTTAYTTRGAQFGLSYDPRLIEVTGVVEGEYYRTWAMRNKASTGLVPKVMIDPERGLVRPFAIAVLGGPPTDGPNGSGSLATVQGRARPGASGTTTLRLEGVEISSVQSSDVNANGSITSVPSATIADAQIAVGDSAALPPPPAARTAEAFKDPAAAGSGPKVTPPPE
jgi:hypothetical protein